MIQAYDDEDNVPMIEDLPMRYPLKTWEEVLEGKHDQGEKRKFRATLRTDEDVWGKEEGDAD
jgi:hypothetical protein